MAFGILATALLAAPSVRAAPGDKQARLGLQAAKKGDCVKAVPLLEEAELARHTPTTSFALAKCYVALSELLRASEVLHALVIEERSRKWNRSDINAQKDAKVLLEEVDARIPTVSFEPFEPYEDLQITLDGESIEPYERRKVAPDVSLSIEAEAPGHQKFSDKLVLREGERRIVNLRLEGPAKPPPKPPEEEPNYALGARFRGFYIPDTYQQMFGEGGQSVYVPGGGITLERRGAHANVVFSLAYANFELGPMPWKANGAPDTEWEIIESDLQALMFTVDLLWAVPLNDSGSVSFRVGGGAGVGWTFLGDLKETQAYFPKGSNGDPYKMKKCFGPDDPQGTYRYCNQRDADADHYNGYTSPSWFADGYKPTIFPWLALPELGLSFRLSRRFSIDVETGLTLTGIMTGIGWRVGL